MESLAWQRFVRQPGSDAYFELAKVAKRIERTGELSAKALQHLWQLVRAEEAPNAKRLPSWQPPIRSALVAIHLRQTGSGEAWEVFCGGTVDMRLWDKVAAVRGKTHPEEAISLYKKLLPHVVNAGTRGAQYGEALELVKAIQALRAAQKQDALFRQELAELRVTWRAKRNFIKLLATAGMICHQCGESADIHIQSSFPPPMTSSRAGSSGNPLALISVSRHPALNDQELGEQPPLLSLARPAIPRSHHRRYGFALLHRQPHLASPAVPEGIFRSDLLDEATNRFHSGF